MTGDDHGTLAGLCSAAGRKLNVTGNTRTGGRKYFREVRGRRIGLAGISYDDGNENLGQPFASREQEMHRCLCEEKEKGVGGDGYTWTCGSWVSMFSAWITASW